MIHITIKKRETINEILKLYPDELIDKTEMMVIDFYRRIIILYNKDNIKFRTIELIPFHIEQLEHLLNK